MSGPLPEIGGIPGPAVLRNNLGFVQQKLGETDVAIASFRKALSGAPELAEARTNLGAALACKGQGDEAVRHIHDALARQNLTRVDAISPGSKVQNPLLPQIPVAKDVLDLSAGPAATLPPVPIPTTPGQALAVHPVLGTLNDQVNASMNSLTEQRKQAEARANASKAPNVATDLRRKSIANLVNTSYDEKDIQGLYDTAFAAIKPVEDFTQEFWDKTVFNKNLECLKGGNYEACFIPWCQSALSGAMGGYRSRMQDLDAAMRAWWAAGPRETGVAANIGDPNWHEIAMVDAREHAAINYALLISTQFAWMGYVKSYEKLCVAGNEPPPPEQGAAPSVSDPGGCQGSLAQKLSGTFKTDVEIPGPAGKEKGTKVGVALKVDCEKVEVELSKKVAGTGDLLSVFGKGEADFKKDTVTLVAGRQGQRRRAGDGTVRLLRHHRHERHRGFRLACRRGRCGGPVRWPHQGLGRRQGLGRQREHQPRRLDRLHPDGVRIRRPLTLEVGLLDRRARVHADHAQLVLPGALEAVRRLRGDDDDVARRDGELLVAGGEARGAGLHDEDLRVGVEVQVRPLAHRVLGDEDRDRGLLAALEQRGAVAQAQVLDRSD